MPKAKVNPPTDLTIMLNLSQKVKRSIDRFHNHCKEDKLREIFLLNRKLT